MLNYIWAGLIILSLVFALVADVGDLRRDTYRNGAPIPVTVAFPSGYDPAARQVPVTVRTDSASWAAHFGAPLALAPEYPGELIQNRDGMELRFAKDATLPEPLATIRAMTSERDNDLRGRAVLHGGRRRLGGAWPGEHRPGPIREDDGDHQGRDRLRQDRGDPRPGTRRGDCPLARDAPDRRQGGADQCDRPGRAAGAPAPLPRIPKDHPALGMIVLNLSANVLGLGNAATPMGIKAMEELQKLNPKKDTATNSMVMLLAINTASVQLVPPVLLVAIMGLQVNQLYFPILICTAVSLIMAIVSAKLLGRLRSYPRQRPDAGRRQRQEG